MTTPAPIRTLRVALAGNPNAGKTSIFNLLTGLHQQVGNWPGVTVERKTGTLRHGDYRIEVIDLPGTYSLSAYSLEEQIAREFVLRERPDIVINVVDAANLARHLQLTVQLLEVGVDVIVALNMWDEFEQTGSRLDRVRMEALLGVPVVATVGHRGRGRRELLDAIAALAEERHSRHRHVPISLGPALEPALGELAARIAGVGEPPLDLPARYLATKLLEGDAPIAADLHNRRPDARGLLLAAEELRQRVRRETGEEPARLFRDGRRGFIAGLLREVLTQPSSDRMAPSRSIDRVLTHRWLGLPIFLGFMWLLFNLTFTLGAPLQSGLEWWLERFSGAVAGLLPGGWIEDLVVDGVIAGVGAVLVFLPNILLLFLGIALLEDTGYMARAAFLTDRAMHVLGLHGQSFIPMLMGFGCSVPAILATRTLANRRDRILTALLVPHMSCSARLPVYILFAGAFFERHAGNVVALIYLLGILMAVLVGRLFSRTLFRHEQAAFVMELPPYRWPTLPGLTLHMWHRARLYLRKMGGVILIASVVFWALSVLPPLEAPASPREQVEHSVLGRVGRAIGPVIEPLGFPWEMGVTLLAGFVAKEVVVSSMAVLYQAEEPAAAAAPEPVATDAAAPEPAATGRDQAAPAGTGATGRDLGDVLRSGDAGLSPLAAFAFMAFVLLYTPCIMTILTIRREFGARWMWFDIGYQVALAWGVAFVIYQGGRLIGLG